MAQIKIADIAQELGICPICLYNEWEAQGSIDTFSSRISFDRILHVKDFQEAKEPISRNGGWIYYCNDHFDDDDCEEPDLEVEIEDCF
jgi:hypothetical protein